MGSLTRGLLVPAVVMAAGACAPARLQAPPPIASEAVSGAPAAPARPRTEVAPAASTPQPAQAPVPTGSPQPPASPSGVAFADYVRPVLEARCQPCHFKGGKMYDKLPFDRPSTIRILGERLFTRIKDPEEQTIIRSFLAQPAGPEG